MPCEEHIRVPVAQTCGGSNFGVNGVGVKIFEKLASEPDRDHKIDSVVGVLGVAPSAEEFSTKPRGSEIGRGMGQTSWSESRRDDRAAWLRRKFR